MANKLNSGSELKNIKEENRRLKAEVASLKELAKNQPKKPKAMSHRLRTLGSVFFVGLAIALLVVGNILFWTGNTVVKTDRYTEATAPIIRNQEVQKAVSVYASDQLFKNVDVDQVVAQVLPPRADFLAPTISGQLKDRTQGTLQKILANPNFQQKWNTVQAKSHQRFISAVEKNGSDGVININELYQQLSANLKNTKLAFLADKPLPNKVGSIQVASGEGLTILQRVITHIDLWRTLALLLFLISVIAGVWLSQKRRRTVILLGLYSVLGMLATLIGFRILREVISGKVDQQYSQAVRETFQIVFHPLLVQTVTIMLAFVLVVFIAWVSGTSKSAALFKARTNDLLAGKLHSALFGSKENAFTLWLGQYKRFIEWAVIGLSVLACLFIRLTPKVLLGLSLTILIAVLLIEALAANSAKTKAV